MKIPLFLTSVLIAGGPAHGELLVHDSFGYALGDLTGNASGTGWPAGWIDTGNPVTVVAGGLGYTDAIGNLLQTSGAALDTADGGAATTISARETGTLDGERWISMLIQPRGTFTDFVGVSFYHQGLGLPEARFAIENAGGKNLRLTRRAAGTPAPPLYTPTFTTTIGSTVFAVLHLVPGGGSGEIPLDRIDVYFNPALDRQPGVPHASVEIDGLQADRIRVAAANGRSVRVDELRIGTTFADVAPFTPAEDPDLDGDGLTASQEALLGLDPEVSDAAFIAALRANPGWIGLHSPDEIQDMSFSPVTLERLTQTQLQYWFEWRDRNGLTLEPFAGDLPVTPGKRFIRLNLAAP